MLFSHSTDKCYVLQAGFILFVQGYFSEIFSPFVKSDHIWMWKIQLNVNYLLKFSERHDH